MITIQQLADHIGGLPIAKEEKDALLLLVQPSFKFRDFLKAKYGLGDVEVESYINLQIAPHRDALNADLEKLDLDDYTNISISRIVKVVIEFAGSEGFKDLDDLSLSLRKILFI